MDGAGMERNMHTILVGELEEKGTLGRHRRKWESDIKVELKDIGLKFDDWNQWTMDGAELSKKLLAR
jgi:hypothetical protein